MKSFFSVLSVLVLTATGCSKSSSYSQVSDLVYGNDDRKNLYEMNDPALRAYAPSVGVILNSFSIQGTGDTAFVKGRTLGQKKATWYHKPLCPSVKFRDEIQPGVCSGFLVSKNVFATAGHCVEDGIDSLRVIFNFSIDDPSQASAPSIPVSRNQIYSFKRIIASKKELALTNAMEPLLNSRGESESVDYAFLELDRPVEGATPFTLEMTPETQIGDPLMIIGHPEGLPLKFADGARVVSDEGIKIFANLDAFHGNSGSLVLNLRTGKVVGIYTTTSLIPDLVYNGEQNCMAPPLIPDNFGGDPPDEGVVKFSSIFGRYLSPSERAAIFSGSSGTDSSIPTGPGMICTLQPSMNGYNFFFTSTNLDIAEVKKIWDGASVEILGPEDLLYAGSVSSGVRLRVLDAVRPPSSSWDAMPGDVLYDYANTFNCR